MKPKPTPQDCPRTRREAGGYQSSPRPLPSVFNGALNGKELIPRREPKP